MAPVEWPEQVPILTDGALVLRPWAPEDHKDVLAACQDAEIQRWTTVPSPYTAEDAEEFLAAVGALWEDRSAIPFAIDLAGERRLAGSIGVVALDSSSGRGELGYWVSPWARGRGVAGSALRLLSEWAFHSAGFSSLHMMIDPGNQPSARAAARAGFEAGRAFGVPLRESDAGDLVVHGLCAEDLS